MPDYSFTVDLAALQKAGQGISDAVQSVKDDDVSDWLPTESQVGHQVVWDALDTFGGRWDVGMNNLTNDVEEAGNRLLQVLKTYTDYDSTSTARLKKTVKSAGSTTFPKAGGATSRGSGHAASSFNTMKGKD